MGVPKMLWAELYGVDHLGAIRSVVAAVGVFGTALGPVTMGSLIDWGLTIEQVCLLFAGYCVLGTCLMFIAFQIHGSLESVSVRVYLWLRY